MQFELEYLMASDRFKDKKPVGSEMPWKPEGMNGIFARAFWKNLYLKIKANGINTHAAQEKTE